MKTFPLRSFIVCFAYLNMHCLNMQNHLTYKDVKRFFFYIYFADVHTGKHYRLIYDEAFVLIQFWHKDRFLIKCKQTQKRTLYFPNQII